VKDRTGAPVPWSPRGAGKLSEANATPILDAVGKELVRPDIDRGAMIRGINLCLQWYHTARNCSTNKGVKEQTRHLEMIYKKARALDQLLAKDDSWSSPLGMTPSSNAFFHAPIKRLIEGVDHAIKKRNDGPDRAYRNSFKIRSPFEWLVGYYLPHVFMLLDVARIRDQKNLLSKESPYTRFVQAVLAELRIGIGGQPYSRATILKAVRSPFVRPFRRKRDVEVNDFSYWREALLRKEMGLPPGPMPKVPQPGFYAIPSPSQETDGANLNQKRISAQDS
jgi:hypothetical protein